MRERGREGAREREGERGRERRRVSDKERGRGGERNCWRGRGRVRERERERPSNKTIDRHTHSTCSSHPRGGEEAVGTIHLLCCLGRKE